MLPIAQLPTPLPELRSADAVSGDRIQINGQPVSAGWFWQGENARRPDRLWLPLDLLEARLGFRRVRGLGGDALEWFGRRAFIDAIPTKTLGDEVGLEVSDWLQAAGVISSRVGSRLELSLPPARLQQLRRGKGSTANRLVLDLSGPVFVQRLGDDLLLALSINPAQQRQLERLGLGSKQTPKGLLLNGQATRLQTLTLAEPWRLVLDGIGGRSAGAASTNRPSSLPLGDQRIAALIRRGLVLDRRTVTVGVKPIRILRAGGDLNRLGVALTPLAMTGQQQGLRYLPQLSRPAGAVIAVNGGFFNRIQQLPLGALRRKGRWLSGPILNRGVVAWGPGSELEFGRLRLDQELRVDGGRRWGLGFLNSGYVQRGLSRYTNAWGPTYRALSGEEQALLVQNGAVTKVYSRAQLNGGVPLPANADLVVARGGAPLPAVLGDSVSLLQQANSRLGDRPNVLGGGPLLMQQGRIVLNGRGEGFSPGFLALAAPRTVVGNGAGGTWLMTVQGGGGSDPTLLETALAMQQLGLRDALNLDGGSSTTMVAAGRTLMNGSGSSPRIHNGLGLVPAQASADATQQPLPLW